MRYDIGKRMDDAGNTVYVLVVNGGEASQHATEAELYMEVQRLMGKERLVEVTAEEVRALQEDFDNLINQMYWFRLDLTLGSVLMVVNCPVS